MKPKLKVLSISKPSWCPIVRQTRIPATQLSQFHSSCNLANATTPFIGDKVPPSWICKLSSFQVWLIPIIISPYHSSESWIMICKYNFILWPLQLRTWGRIWKHRPFQKQAAQRQRQGKTTSLYWAGTTASFLISWKPYCLFRLLKNLHGLAKIIACIAIRGRK